MAAVEMTGAGVLPRPPPLWILSRSGNAGETVNSVKAKIKKIRILVMMIYPVMDKIVKHIELRSELPEIRF